jgi:hypothetical protein
LIFRFLWFGLAINNASIGKQFATNPVERTARILAIAFQILRNLALGVPPLHFQTA